MSKFFSQIMKGNKWLWGIYIALFVLSCLVTTSAMSRLVIQSTTASAPVLRHILFLFLGFAIVMLIQTVNFRLISLVSIPSLILAVGILVYVTASGGVNSESASRFSILGQPSEYVKLALILTLSDVIMNIRKCKEFPKLTFWIVVAIVGVIILLIFTENLSSAVII